MYLISILTNNLPSRSGPSTTIINSPPASYQYLGYMDTNDVVRECGPHYASEGGLEFWIGWPTTNPPYLVLRANPTSMGYPEQQANASPVLTLFYECLHFPIRLSLTISFASSRKCGTTNPPQSAAVPTAGAVQRIFKRRTIQWAQKLELFFSTFYA